METTQEFTAWGNVVINLYIELGALEFIFQFNAIIIDIHYQRNREHQCAFE